MTIGELVFELGFNADTVKINDFIGMVSKLNLNSVLASFGVKELYDGLLEIMGIADKTAIGMNLFGAETGLSAQKMTQWTKYAEQMGVSGDTVNSALTGIQKKMVGLQLGIDSSLLTPLYMLNQAGAHITNEDLNNPFQFLEKALQGLQKVNPELRTTIAGMLGINEQLLTIHSFKGADLLSAPSQEQVSRLMEYHKGWQNLAQTLNQVAVDIGSYLADDFKNITNIVSGFLQAFHNTEGLREMLKILITIAGVTLAVMFPLIRIPLLILSAFHALSSIKNFYDAEFKPRTKNFDIKNAHNLRDPNEMTSYLSKVLPEREATDTPNKSITQSNTFNISGADPKQIGKEVHKVINEQISNSLYQQQVSR